jgi:hypothetical protein
MLTVVPLQILFEEAVIVSVGTGITVKLILFVLVPPQLVNVSVYAPLVV